MRDFHALVILWGPIKPAPKRSSWRYCTYLTCHNLCISLFFVTPDYMMSSMWHRSKQTCKSCYKERSNQAVWWSTTYRCLWQINLENPEKSTYFIMRKSYRSGFRPRGKIKKKKRHPWFLKTCFPNTNGDLSICVHLKTLQIPLFLLLWCYWL
jgi:hypothetical protein